MARYDTKKSLLEEIGRKAQDVARQYLTWEPDYDETDFMEIWERIQQGKQKSDGKSMRPRTVRKSKDTLPPFLGDLMSEHLLRPFGVIVRKCYGYDKPIPLKSLERELRKIEASNPRNSRDKRRVIVWYPKQCWVHEVHEGFPICDVDYLELPEIEGTKHESIENGDVKLQSGIIKARLGDILHLISYILHCHPAEATAYLFCNYPIQRNRVSIALQRKYGSRITIYVKNKEVPIWIIKAVYSAARYKLLGFTRENPTESPRPRTMSDRVMTLLLFTLGNESLSWKELWERWNNQYPDWAYLSENSIRVVSYRAEKRIRPKPRGLGVKRKPKGGKK